MDGLELQLELVFVETCQVEAMTGLAWKTLNDLGLKYGEIFER
jgi:hypothetical protein